MRKIFALLAAVMLTFTMSAPAAATHLGGEDTPTYVGYYTNSAISDGNLTMCFDGPVMYNNRDVIAAATRLWSRALRITFTSTGNCETNDQSNIQFQFTNWGQNGTIADAGPNGGGSIKTIRFNGAYSWWWSGSGFPGSNNSVYTVAAHEVGHALGMDHESTLFNGPNGHNDKMDSGFCTKAFSRDLSEYDARALRQRYPGLTPTSTTFSLNAPCTAP